MAGALLIPFAEHRLDGVPNGPCRPTVCCFHTSVTSAPAPAATCSIEWNGHVVQHRYANVASAANLNSNYRVAAFECMDKGAGFAPHDDDSNTQPPMTAAQCESGAKLLVWYWQEWGVPIRFVRDSRPSTTGTALHRAGVDGNFAGYAFPGRTSGGELWSQVYGKICPRDVRGIQVRDIIVPRALWLAGTGTGIDMPLTDTEMNALANMVTDRVLARVGGVVWGTQMGNGLHAAGHLTNINTNAWLLPGLVKEVGGLADDEVKIVTAMRDEQNPATTRMVQTIISGVQTLMEAHHDPELTIGPDETRALAAAMLEGLDPAVRTAAAAALADALAELAEHAQAST